MTSDPAKRLNLSERHCTAFETYGWNPLKRLIRNRTTVKRQNLFGLALPFMLLAGQVMAASYTVTNRDDSGVGSLRAAILAANANQGSTVAFATTGTINLLSALPQITSRMTIDGTTAPGFSGTQTPLVSINFNSSPGLTVAVGADGSSIKSLSLFGALNAVTLQASKVTVQGNYIGLQTNGVRAGNFGDGVKIVAPSGGNLIGSSDPVSSVDYFNALDPAQFTIQPTAWQGIRNNQNIPNSYLICGTEDNNIGLLYLGPIAGGGQSFKVIYPGSNTLATSVYGPDNLSGNAFRLVGSYRFSGSSAFNYGFVWEGTTSQLPSGGSFRTINYPGAKYQFTHSTMGNLAVGNADGPKQVGNQTLPIGPGVAYIYNLTSNSFVTNIVFPGSKKRLGIWHLAEWDDKLHDLRRIQPFSDQ
jgi:hypothetical protein